MNASSSKTKPPVPRHANEDAEREYWAEHDSTEHVDWSRARPLRLPDLKPTLRSISLRLPEYMIEQLKALANRRDVPYQSLLKIFLAERLQQELGGPGGPASAKEASAASGVSEGRGRKQRKPPR